MTVPSLSIFSSRAKKLTENYDRPRDYVIDNIDVIEDEEALTEALVEYNDITGICPVVYTCYIDEYAGQYSDCESFAYDKYLEMFSDERHYLIVYSIPQSQAQAYASGELEVPDFIWEIMVGDDTDRLYTAKVQNDFVSSVHSGFDRGDDVGQVIASAIRTAGKQDENLIKNSSGINLSRLIPTLFVGLFFLIPLVGMIKSFIRERKYDYEEVPLQESDIPSGGASQRYTAFADVANVNNLSSGLQIGIKMLYMLFLLPFIAAGIFLVVMAIKQFTSGSPSGTFMLVFALLWNLIIVSVIVTLFRKPIGPKSRARDALGRSPASDYDRYAAMARSHDDCEADHSDDDDDDYFRKRGYE